MYRVMFTEDMYEGSFWLISALSSDSAIEQVVTLTGNCAQYLTAVRLN